MRKEIGKHVIFTPGKVKSEIELLRKKENKKKAEDVENSLSEYTRLSKTQIGSSISYKNDLMR